jgi:hypothetical protein
MDLALQRLKEEPSRKFRSEPAKKQDLFDEDITY